MATDIRVPLARQGLPGQIKFRNDAEMDACMQAILVQLSEAEKQELGRAMAGGLAGTPVQRKAAGLVINWMAARRQG